ncbi:site-specific recombinase, DNA invertase Pin [Desulfocurvibacter africanus PCS]|uniref:Site-specific recombinase, DNA invertase Pin n=2 Tax=Desulfocurvibacter africanus TaxID=873 RepID=M5PXI6_DESAF|nr:site-specific recombinase, DNA invertase Pin [Desulfocurvibacter africanus PCS]
MDHLGRPFRDVDGTLRSIYIPYERGKKTDRPQLRKSLEHCSLTGAILVIAKLDRLSRDAHFLLGLQKAQVRFVCADMPQANELTVGIMALVAEAERKLISKRTKEALAAAKARGVRLGCPNGAQHLRKYGNAAGVEAVMTKASKRAESLRDVIERIKIQGMTSANAIAQELNRQRIATPRGGMWYAASVSRLLQRL